MSLRFLKVEESKGDVCNRCQGADEGSKKEWQKPNFSNTACRVCGKISVSTGSKRRGDLWSPDTLGYNASTAGDHRSPLLF